MLPSAIFALATLCFGAASASLTCKSESQPNPIPKAGGTNPTGTINGTIAILPIPLEEARRIIGDNYTIQTGAYHSQLPTFPGNMYPALLQAVVDHDVQANGVSIPDFSRVSIEFPFLSIPGANPNTLFRLAPIQAISATNPVALAGSAAYGTRVLAAVFDPPCDAYASLEGAPLTIFDARKPARAAIAGDTLFTSAFATVGGGTEGGDVGP
ncbi:hypothetical protein UCDDS831_g04375 [Diplodia seriata]|uniref:Uncharacterized protein n=1 Tax=Diplodia seriata TaxID=420778 RepID=A0A0G2GBU4_9PEZI|nr:hypothetical protein UCDDS831_g04375 [Diplodia seriata]